MLKICIDPGHGGNDPGAIGVNGAHEKDINLSVALAVAKQLQLRGVVVAMTREADESVDLAERVRIAEEFGADYFISIHANSASSPEASGVETYCYKIGGQGEKLAAAIQVQLVAILGETNRGVKEGNFQVLRETNMPAVLVELGFLSNPDEAAKLVTGEYQCSCKLGIIEGLFDFAGLPAPVEPGGEGEAAQQDPPGDPVENPPKVEQPPQEPPLPELTKDETIQSYLYAVHNLHQQLGQAIIDLQAVLKK